MKIKIFFDRTNEEKIVKLKGIKNIKQLLEKLNINPVEVVIVKNGKIVIESEKINDGDEIKIIPTVSGG